MFELHGEQQTMSAVRELPPSESCIMRVSLEERVGAKKKSGSGCGRR